MQIFMSQQNCEYKNPAKSLIETDNSKISKNQISVTVLENTCILILNFTLKVQLAQLQLFYTSLTVAGVF